jgi:hypothetical protein
VEGIAEREVRNAQDQPSQGHDSIWTLRLEGKLVGPWVTELARSCNELPCPPNRLRLDLSAVTFVDRRSVALLRDLLARGATLAACSGLLAELLHVER